MIEYMSNVWTTACLFLDNEETIFKIERLFNLSSVMTNQVFKLVIPSVHSSTVCQMFKIFALIYIVNFSFYFIWIFSSIATWKKKEIHDIPNASVPLFHCKFWVIESKFYKCILTIFAHGTHSHCFNRKNACPFCKAKDPSCSSISRHH